MNHPPAPVFHDADMSVLAPKQACAVKQTDGNSGQQCESNETAVMTALQRGIESTQDQTSPQQQADEEEDLPEAPQINIFVALMTEPEVHCAGEELIDPEPFASK
ncbi:hypothetical protein PsAD14_01856 [Pseudovibrio sp. Ad14]|nr:hypothetical protein PsAD14_01856 [Pseudovibrio sp. Ad14]